MDAAKTRMESELAGRRRAAPTAKRYWPTSSSVAALSLEAPQRAGICMRAKMATVEVVMYGEGVMETEMQVTSD